MGTLFTKDADGVPILDGNGMLVPSSTNVIPDRGVILSTGLPDDFFYNDADSHTTNYTDLGPEVGGDADLLNSIIGATASGTLCPFSNAGQTDGVNGSALAIHDACVLEFEFRCANLDGDAPDQITFNYIFGSEEYYEFVDNEFNDVFGFYLNSENIATVTPVDPEAEDVIVAINSVNQLLNTQMFNGNDPSEGRRNEDDPTIGVLYPLIEADGFTNTLDATATPNLPWNSMKLAIGDTCDEILDSWVLLERQSFACRAPTVSPSTAPSLVPSISLVPTAAPTNSPTASPTTPAPTSSPTTSPSSLPSLQPSFVEQFITTAGTVSISLAVCSLDQAGQDAFRESAQLSISQELGDPDLEVAITNFCDSQRRLETSSSSSRGLQEPQFDDWQLFFTITEFFVCERASCNSNTDFATTDSIISSITTPLRESFDGPDFLSVIRRNMLTTGEFTSEDVLCIAVWGAIGSAVPLVTSDTGVDGAPLFYPDFQFDSGTCLQGAANAPRYMQLDPESWLYSDLAGCCGRYFAGWNENACNNVNGSGLWYVSHLLELCVTDCRVGNGQFCGGLAQDISDDLFTDPRSCCNADLPWRFIEHCEAFSLQNTCYRGTMLYHRGDNEGDPVKSNVCVRDCDPVRENDLSCGGLIEDTYIELWTTAEECCAIHHEWMNPEICAARSNVVPLNKWWPDETNSLCILDSQTPTKELSITVYDSTVECCTEAINWLSVAECRARSGDTTILAATNLYYVDWGRERCVQDCEGDAPCVGLGEAQPWDETYETASACCAMLSWIPRSECFGVGFTVSRNLLDSN